MTDEERAGQNRVRSGRRAAQDLRAKIRSANLSRLMTFTNGGTNGGWDTYREALADVMAWYATAGHQFFGDSPIVFVAERGAKGRIHVHAAIRRGFRVEFLPVIQSWSAWLTALGFTSSSATHRWHLGDDTGKHSEGFSSARVCANYMAKYLSKGFQTDERQLYEKRYRTLGVRVEEPRRVSGFTLADVRGLLEQTFPDRRVELDWYESPDGDYGGFFIEVHPDEAKP